MDWSLPTAQILGRFDPWNAGHKALVDEVLRLADPDRQAKGQEPTSEAQQVVIMVRNTGKNNFYAISADITNALESEYSGRYEIIKVPNITNIFYGRQVGFDVDRIDLPSNLEPVENRKSIRAEEKESQRRFWAGRQ